MDATFAGLLGAIIGAMASLLGSFLSTWLLIRKEREKLLIEKQTEREFWLRERLQETYSHALESLARLTRRSVIIQQMGTNTTNSVLSQEHQRELFDDFSDSKKWLGLLFIYHPNKLSDEFKQFAQISLKFSDNELPDLILAAQLRSLILAMASLDDRFQINLYK